MTARRQVQLSFPKDKLFIVQDPDPNPEEMEALHIEALSDEEVFLAIQYLDPDLDGPDANQLVIVSAEAILLAIQYLDPDFQLMGPPVS